jgi:hypothetical protein
MVIERLSLLWKRFSPLEERLWAEVRTVIPAAAREAFDGQVAAINRVQRSPGSWSEICFYCMRSGRVDWSGVPLFPCTDEFRLAEVRFRVGKRTFRTALTSIGGHVFDFVTIPGPNSVAFVPWDAEPSVSLLGDPMRTPSGQKEPEKLPPVWERLLAQRAGQGTREWQIHDHTNAYRIAMDDGEYLVLAERESDEFVLYRVEPPSDGLFFLPHHDAVPEPFIGDVEALVGV